MPINLLSVAFKHERRLRLVFDNGLAAGAFGLAPTFYTVTSSDNLGPSPAVTAALVIAGNANAVELALSADLAQGGLYQVSAIGVPAVDSSTTTAAATTAARFPIQQARLNQEVSSDDYASLIYGVDLAHNGTDYVETADGDLATVSGLSNASVAIRRRLAAAGLPWDPTYGPNLRRFVDGTQGALPLARGDIVRQCVADDRVQQAVATLNLVPTEPQNGYFDVNVTLIGGEVIQPIPVSVPTV